MKTETVEAGVEINTQESSAARAGSVTRHALYQRPVFLAIVDLAIGLAAYAAAWFVRVNFSLPLTLDLLPQERWTVVSHPWLALILSQLFFLYLLGLYDDLRVTRYREIVAFTFVACTLQVIIITSSFFFAEQVFPRTVILLFDTFNFLGLVVWRSYVKGKLKAYRFRVLIVGESADAARDIIRDIEASPWMGMDIAGLVLHHGPPAFVEGNYPVLGTLDEVEDLVSRYGIDEIIFASHPSWRDRALDRLGKAQEERRIRIAVLPSIYEMMIGKLRHINIHDTPLIEVKLNPNEPLERFLKRTFDIVCSALGLLISLPLLILVALAIKVSSRGPVFYRQERVGLGGRVFSLVKFRTMVPDAEKETGEVLAVIDDPRITPIGRLLRRTRLDELPQLINVLLGDMSFVGPRPERPSIVRRLERKVVGYAERHRIKPGITGLAQVRGFYHTRAENKLKYDLAYIYNYSYSLDLLILLETIKVMIKRKGT